MRRPRLIAGLILISAASGAVAEPAQLADGCAPIATVIYEHCVVEVVSTCEWLEPDWRLYGRYIKGELDSSTVREDGIFQRVYAGGDIRRTLEFPAGMLARLIKDGDGAVERQNFTATVETEDGTETSTGSQLIRNLGTQRLDLASGPIDVLRLSADAELSDGSGNVTIRYLDLETHVLLGYEGRVTYPDRAAVDFHDRALWRLLPGDAGFGETTPPPGASCGAAG